MFDDIGGKQSIEDLKSKAEPTEVIGNKRVFHIATETGTYAIVIKDIYRSFAEIPENELQQRRESIRIFEESLPHLSIPNEIALVEDSSILQETVRISPWIYEATPFSELKLINILTDPEKLCAIAEVANFCIDQLKNNGRRFDFLKGPDFEYLPEQIRAIMKVVHNINLFEGKDSQGRKVIFADSDWFANVEEDSPIFNHSLKTWERTSIAISFIINMIHWSKRKL